jgi:hypothetical protein
MELKGGALTDLPFFFELEPQQRAALCCPVAASRQWHVALARGLGSSRPPGGGGRQQQHAAPASRAGSPQHAAQPSQGGVDRRHFVGAGEPLS